MCAIRSWFCTRAVSSRTASRVTFAIIRPFSTPTWGPEVGALLELAEVTAGYGGGDILHGLDLSVEEGAITCIVGPHGAGKSTVLRAVSGLLRPPLGLLRFPGH